MWRITPEITDDITKKTQRNSEQLPAITSRNMEIGNERQDTIAWQTLRIR